VLFVGAGIRLVDDKGLIKEECLQSTFESNDSVTLRILNGIELPVVAAECLNARDATDLGRVTTHVVSVSLTFTGVCHRHRYVL